MSNTKTASVRLEKKLYDKIDEHCVREECSRNDFIKSAIETALDEDDDVVPELKVISIDGVPVKSEVVGVEY